MITGTGAVLLAESRDIAKIAQDVSPLELIDGLNHMMSALIASVEKHEGIVHLYVGGCLIAFWAPSKMPAAMHHAISAAVEAVSQCGSSLAVSVAIGEFAVSEVGPPNGKRPILVGAAYQSAESILRLTSGGSVTVDARTLAALPPDIRDRFVSSDGHAILR